MNEKKLMWGEGVTCSHGVCNNEYHSFHYHLSKFMQAIQKSVSQYGFRLIYYTPNDLLERNFSEDKKYYSFFDIVLYKKECR